MKHYSVLKKEAIDALNIKDGGIYVDATIGYAGHSKEILKQIPNGYLYGLDQDKLAVESSTNTLKEIGDNFKIFNTNFVNLKEVLDDNNIEKVDGILFDLGFSSPQIDDESRGFSFMHDGPLDMRMSNEGKSAKDIIDNYSEEMLADVFFKYGEERLGRVIARKVKSECRNHPERKIFQALRIEVNNELKVLESVLPDAINKLNKGGRIVVITFHSLEDRIVKNVFKDKSEVDELVKGLRDIPEEYKPLIKLINKKPILPSDEELAENSRSRSAKLRVVERI